MTRIRGLKEVIERDEAVSPIIATILLVAITVILASTLYLALGGFFKSGTTSTPTVGVSVTNTTAAGGSFTYTITVSAPSSNTISWASTEWIITNGTGHVTLVNTTNGWIANSGNYKITGSTGNYVTGGDVLTLTISTVGLPNPLSIVFEMTGSNGGQMGSASL